MHRTPLRLLTIALAFSAVASAAHAQSNPPIKPGLWQVQGEREVNGQKAPDPMERMKDLPPEARKQMEAMMKKRGVEMAQGGVQKICHSRESLNQGQWKGDSEKCKTEITSRSASAWKWHSSCTQPESEMDGEALFSSTENYTVKTSMTTKHQGQAQTMRMTVTAKWLGADCGELKPMQRPAATQ
jgi:hypothetical protein